MSSDTLPPEVMRNSFGAPSEPPTSSSSFVGCRATLFKPPFNAPGVMLVMLSIKRCVLSSMSFIDISRLTVIT